MERIKKFFKSVFAKSEKDILRDEILNESIDFGNVVSSSLLAKDLYDELLGFDEKLAVAFNDVDFCMKVRKKDENC